MLYVTTRNSQETYTSHHALTKDRGCCDGLFLPFQKHVFSLDELEALLGKSFCQCVAEVLNLFFSARMDAWDVECCIGSYPLRLVPMSHKITVAEIWNNPEWSFSRFARNLNARLQGSNDTGKPSSWTLIAIRIAVLFGVFGRLKQLGLMEQNQRIDLSVCSGDFSAPMAAWYARRMGLPIGTIIFNCNDNSSAWDLLHRGELHTNDPIIPTATPLCDVSVPINIERLICETLGMEEVMRYAAKSACASVFLLNDEQRQQLCNGFFGAVIGKNRTESIIRNVYRTSAYLLSPYSALAYGGLQDYRAANTEPIPALIVTEEGPLSTEDAVANAVGITKEVLRERVRSL